MGDRTKRRRSHLFIMAGSVAPAVLLRVALFVAWSVVVVLFHRFVHRVEVAATVHILLGVALGLLLVFRTNASYERFWEGRTLWGGIVNESRNLARSACAARRGELSDYWTVAIDGNVQLLVNDIGSCERIQRTPMPFAYDVHLRRALVLYCLTLPFVLVGQFGWSTVLYTFLFTYVFCGIDEIGVEIENPFGVDPNDLPLERLCAGIEYELLALLHEQQAADASGVKPA